MNSAAPLIARLRKAGRTAEADLVAVVWNAIQTHPQGDNGLLLFAGSLAEASARLEAHHQRQRIEDC